MADDTTWLRDTTQDLCERLDGVGIDAPAFDDPEDLVLIEALLRRVDDSARAAISAVEARLCVLLPPGESLTVPGVAQVSVSVSARKVHHGDRLARRLAARVADTPADADGVMLPPAELCARTADELVVVFGLGNQSQTFRTGEIKKRGLLLGEFVSYEDGTPRVTWVPG